MNLLTDAPQAPFEHCRRSRERHGEHLVERRDVPARLREQLHQRFKLSHLVDRAKHPLQFAIVPAQDQRGNPVRFAAMTGGAP
jgi:hypothetical protein